MMKTHLLLAVGTPEELAELAKLKQAREEEQYERAVRRTTDSIADILPVALPAAGLTLLMAVLALAIFRSSYANRWPRLRAFFGRPLDVRSRRDLAPHPSPRSPRAGEIPLILRPPSTDL